MKQRFMATSFAFLALAAVGCGTGDDVSSGDELVRASVSLAQGSAVTGTMLVNGDSGSGVIDPDLIDSLMVEVVRVEMLPSRRLHRCHPPVGDSIVGFRPSNPGPGVQDSILDDRPGGFHDGAAGPPPGRPCSRHNRDPLGPDFGPPGPPVRPDSVVAPPDSGWGSRPWHWFSLGVLGNGHIDLTNLPTDSSAGIVLAAGDLPPGEYVAARLIIRAATIWFNTEITTDSGVVLKPDTGYAVKLPRRGEDRKSTRLNSSH